MYLFFDTETTGLPRRWNAPVTEVDNWPRMVQLAWIACDDGGEVLEECSDIIRPEGYAIPYGVARIHGITTTRGLVEGKHLKEVLGRFAAKLEEATALVGHNITFDQAIVGAEFEREHMTTSLFHKPAYCTMRLSTRYCQLPGKRGCKAPKLSELHQVLFGTAFCNAHDALADVRATVRCFWKLKKLNVIA